MLFLPLLMEKVKKQTISKSKKVWNIISYILVFVFFLLALICAIFKFQGASFTIFGNRYDVVLTNSMSEKNPKYEEFLKGHDDQFKAFDLAVSKPISSPDDLHVYDVVIYNDRDVGTNMHRIVGIEENGVDIITYHTGEIKTISSIEGIAILGRYDMIETTDISFKEMTMTVYTETNNTDSHYNFSVLNNALSPSITIADQGKGKLITYTIKKDSGAPGKLHINHSITFDTSKEIITSLNIKATTGNIESNSNNVSPSNGDLQGQYNKSYRYEIRGDKAEYSDGFYSYKELQAKVTGNIPGMGYMIRFLNSIWGGIMFLLLGFLIIAFQIISDHMDKKAAKEDLTNGAVPREEKKEEKPQVEQKKDEAKTNIKIKENAKAEDKKEPQTENKESAVLKKVSTKKKMKCPQCGTDFEIDPTMSIFECPNCHAKYKKKEANK